MTRRIFPVIGTVTEDGFRRLSEAESEEYARQVVESRMTAPDGPPAPLRSSNQ
jgi:proteasome beta subunit